MDNWLITTLTSVGAFVFAAAAAMTYYWAKRGAPALTVWAAWAALTIFAVCAIAISVTSGLDSGPAEAVAVSAGILGLTFCAILPMIHKRITRSELNRVISKDL